MSAGTRYSASHPILAIRSCFNLEGYSVGVVLRFVGFGPPSFLDLIDIFSRSHACSHNRSPIGPALEANASGWIRSIGAHFNISQQGRGKRPQCHSGGHAGARHGSWKRLHTERDKSRLEMAGLCGFREVAASQSRMTCDLDSTKRAVL